MAGNGTELDHYRQMSIPARQELANRDPGAARIMALGNLLILATRGGLEAIHARTQQELGRSNQSMRDAVESFIIEPDWKENNTGLYKKGVEAPAYRLSYLESAGEVILTHIYAEDLDGRLGFGNLFEAAILYPDQSSPTVRRYALVGPNESGKTYHDPNADGGSDFRALSYLSPIGRAVWGADIADVAEHPIICNLPDQGNATIIAINVLGHVADIEQ